MNRIYLRWFFLILIFLPSLTIGQIAKEGSVWYFDYSEGVDFKFEPPKPLSDSRYFGESHSSTICDSSGNLLFYSSGDSVWNRNHKPMVNGFDLNDANFPIYTTSVIVPHPGDGQLYYIFKTNQESYTVSPTGLHYSVVDMSADNGMGSVIFKTHNFIPVVSPLISVTLHADEKSYWVIVHGWEDNLFYAVHVTEAGIEEPIFSAIGGVYGNTFDYVPMQMKVSPDGTKLGVVGYDGNADLYDFNSNTGVVSNFRHLDVISTGGIEFSPNSELLYISAYFPDEYGYLLTGISQLDVSTGLLEEINASEIQIGIDMWSDIGELQLAPNGKIYGGNILLGGQIDPYPCVIDEPNVRGLDCNFIDDGLLLPGGNPRYLPLSVQSIFRESPAVPMAKGCKGMAAQIRVTSLGYADSLQWDFGDGTQKSFPLSTGKIVNHVYEQTGEYTLSVKKYIGNLSRELVSEITIIEMPVVNIGADTTLCHGDKLLLDGGSDGIKFTWSTGEATQQIEVGDENQYQVIVDNGVCTTSDIISVQVYDYPVVELGSDKIICDSESLTLAAPSDPNFNYQWNSGSTSQEITIMENGLYELTVSQGRCETMDQINVQFGQIIISLSETELEVPFDEELNLEAIGTNMEAWRWNFGDGLSDDTTSPVVHHSYLKSGEYEGKVMVTNQYGCSADASFRVIVPKYLFIPNVITPNNDTKNELFEIQYNGDEQPNLMIYDRWGKTTFYSQSFESKWSAEGSDPGVYFYELKLGQESYKGWIHVVK